MVGHCRSALRGTWDGVWCFIKRYFHLIGIVLQFPELIDWKLCYLLKKGLFLLIVIFSYFL